MSLNSEIINYFKNKPVKKVYLFGSSVNDEAKANDIDILIELEPNHIVTLFDMGKWTIELENTFHKKVDLITTENINVLIKPFIEAQKKLIFNNPKYA
jgi:predicted nucleotidyltransferase